MEDTACDGDGWGGRRRRLVDEMSDGSLIHNLEFHQGHSILRQSPCIQDTFLSHFCPSERARKDL